MPANRKQRLQESLRAELSEVLRREMRDPRFTEGLLSITDVEVSADYKHATVYVSVLGDQQARKDSLNALRGASGVLRGELGRRKTFNTVPELHFKYDESLERGAHMFEVLERIKREDAAREARPLAEPEAE
ncbi:MAG: 30S ribosome-binding factor RbfA [Armatimonadetes bacterium]|nr:30S ribosome-binding factor RbfA [Armatimonadota bacterium]